MFLRALLLLQDEELGVDGAAAGAVEPVGEGEGEEGAEEEGEDDGVVGGHVVHFLVVRERTSLRGVVFLKRTTRGAWVGLCE